MYVRGEKDALIEAGQAALPVLGGVRITADARGVEFAGTDLEMFVAVRGDFRVEEEGVSVVPGRLFGEILRSLPDGQVAIRAQGGEVTIEAGRVEFSVSALPVDEFPELGGVEEGAVGRVPGGDLASALKQVVRAASTDEARPVLTGVLWASGGESLRLVATDSYRLAVREVVVKEAGTPRDAIVPGRALGEFGRHLGGLGEAEAEITLGETRAVLVAGRVRLVTRLIEGEFPNYRQLIPEGYPSRLIAERGALVSAVARVGVVAQMNTPVKVHLGSEVMLTASEPGIGEAQEVVEGARYEGEEMVMAFNPRFFGEGLEAVEGEQAVVEVIDPTKPAIVRAEGRKDFVYLVMPVRLGR